MQGNIAQKNMQDMLQLKILGHDENLSKIARKKYVRTANLKMPSGKVEIGNVTVYDDFKFSDSMNRVENLRIDLKQTFINQLIFAAMYIGISFFIMIFTVGYVHEITYVIIVLIAFGIILRDWMKLKSKSRVIRGEYQKRRMVHFFRTSEVKDITVYRDKSKLYVRMSNGIKEMTCEAELCNEEKENFDDMVQQGVSVIFRNQNNKISLMSFMEKKGVRMKC